MQISIQQEKSGMYFAKIVNEEGIHAVASSPQESVEILLDMYKEINAIRHQKFSRKLFGEKKTKNKLFVGMPHFRSLTMSI